MDELTPAAQYVRMSTEHQRYSPLNQKLAIKKYADERGYKIVETYLDHGKSGLSLRGREGLKQLLADIIGGKSAFKAVLVLDVSRWGRFQDPDQAAHYEFLCREAGVTIRYCVEQFENDGTPVSSLVKHIKRVMAGEYSRELGMKALAGALTGARLGFKQGGAAPYGLRRLLLDETGSPAMVLEHGDQNTVPGGRVVYIAGPDEETSNIRMIFHLYARKQLSPGAIAKLLAVKGRVDDAGRSFTCGRVRHILRQPLYSGVYTYNRTTRRLHSPMTINPPGAWIQFEMLRPIVSKKLFQAAQGRFTDVKRPNYTTDQLLLYLRELLEKHGRLNYTVINDSAGPCPALFYNRFGSLFKAYEAIGYTALPRSSVRTPEFTDDQLIEHLKRILKRENYITGALIDAEPGTSTALIYRRRFGNLTSAYRAAGWNVTAQQLSHAGNARRQNALAEIRSQRKHHLRVSLQGVSYSQR